MGLAAVGELIQLLLWIFIILLLSRIVLDYVQMLGNGWRPTGFVAVISEGIYSITDPPLRAVRGVIPPVRLGGAMLDLSPMIVIIGVYLLFIVVSAVFR